MTDDNITILDAVGSATEIRTDYSTSGSAHMQVVKLALGADGVEEFVSRGQQVAGSSVPVVIPAAQLAELTTALAENKTALENLLTELRLKADLTETQPISGSVTATGTFYQDTQPVSGSVVVSSGSMEITGTVPVSGTFFQETQPVSGSVAVIGTVPVSGAYPETQPVSGTFWQETQPVSGSVSVTGTVTANTGLTQPLTDTQLRASAPKVQVVFEFDGDIYDDLAAFKIPVNVTDGSGREIAFQADSAADLLGQAAVPILAVRHDSSGSLVDTDGDYATLQVDADGRLYTNACDYSNSIYAGTSCTPKFFSVAGTAGNTTAVAAVVGKKIRVLDVDISASEAMTVKLQSGAGGTMIKGAYMAANSTLSLPYCKLGKCETAAGAILNLNITSGSAFCSGTYIEV